MWHSVVGDGQYKAIKPMFAHTMPDRVAFGRAIIIHWIGLYIDGY